MRTLYATSVPLPRHRCALIPRTADRRSRRPLPDRPAATRGTTGRGAEVTFTVLLTARDLTARGFAPRTAQRLLARLARQGHAVTVQTGGRPALAVDAATLATLAGCDLETVGECR